jgi:hypothetical protein
MRAFDASMSLRGRWTRSCFGIGSRAAGCAEAKRMRKGDSRIRKDCPCDLQNPLEETLLHPPPFEESGVRDVPLDISVSPCSAALTSTLVFGDSLLTSASAPMPLWLRLEGGTDGISL